MAIIIVIIMIIIIKIIIMKNNFKLLGLSYSNFGG